MAAQFVCPERGQFLRYLAANSSIGNAKAGYFSNLPTEKNMLTMVEQFKLKYDINGLIEYININNINFPFINGYKLTFINFNNINYLRVYDDRYLAALIILNESICYYNIFEFGDLYINDIGLITCKIDRIDKTIYYIAIINNKYYYFDADDKIPELFPNDAENISKLVNLC